MDRNRRPLVRYERSCNLTEAAAATVSTSTWWAGGLHLNQPTDQQWP